MTAAQWQRVREMFESLLDRDPEEAARSLKDGELDEAVVKEVLSLLAYHRRAGTFLDVPPLVAQVEEDELPAGTRLGPYRIVREAGRGGMGRTHLAIDTRLEREVCLKALRSALTGDARSRERLRREARLAASLSHPGICAVFALEELDGDLYLVTEFVDGRTMREEIAGGSAPEAGAVFETARALASALAAAHAKGIIHRDLKPENVMRAADGRLKILDFGLARGEPGSRGEIGTATLSGALMGTPAYMAPEQLHGLPADARSDVFALGILIHEYATATHPFGGPTLLATTARILDHDPEPLEVRRPDLAPLLASVVERCLRKAPADRFASAIDVAAALEGEATLRRHPARRPWWRIHQCASVAVYLIACATAWQIKEWNGSATSRWGFLILGVLATLSGIMRSHLLFTERMHADRLTEERRRLRAWLLVADLVMALLLFADAVHVSMDRPLAAALTMGLAAGIAAAVAVIEPATVAATFGSAPPSR